MTSITIPLSDDLLVKLKDLARHHNVSPEELVRASVEELVTSPEDAFQKALDHILIKNKELYERLAA